MFRFYFIILSFFLFTSVNGQNTFQKIYDSGAVVQASQATLTANGHVLMAGIASYNSTDRFFVSQTDCQGEVIWFKVYENSGFGNNSSPRILETADNGFLIAYNVGFHPSLNMMVMKLDEMGNTVWKKLMNAPRNDKIHGATITPDGGYLLVGTTNSFGQDTSGPSSLRDIYVVRLDVNGDLVWSRTYGNKDAIEEAWDVVVTANGDYAITGRYAHNDAAYVLLLVLDDTADIITSKVYGKSNHRNYGLGISNTTDNNLVITGRTSLNKIDFDSDPDAFLLKVNTIGDPIWAHSYTGTENDWSEFGTSVVELPNGGFAMSIATTSYPTVGAVPNKHVVYQTDQNGNLTSAVGFVNESAHFPSLHQSANQTGLLLVGFSSNNTIEFKPHVTRINDELNSGCNDIDYTNQTLDQLPLFEVESPPVSTGTGGQWIAATTPSNEATFTTISTVCEEIITTDCAPLMTSTATLSSHFSVGNIAPNPAVDQIQIELDLTKSEEVQLLIYGQNGVLFMKNKMMLPSGKQQYDVSLKDLTNGIYFLKMKIGTQVVNQKLVVMRS